MDSPIVDVFLWCLIGLLTATAIHFLDSQKIRGVVGSFAAGVLGALAGGVMTGVVFGTGGDEFLAQSSIFATAGSLTFVFWTRVLFTLF